MTELPMWVAAGSGVAQAVATAAQVYVGIRTSRQKSAEQFGRLIEEFVALPPERIAELLEEESVAEVVGRAWEAAARSASEAKRRVLARVAAATLLGGADAAQVDAELLLVRTLDSVDEPHLRLLLAVAEPRRGTGPLAGTALEGSARVAALQKAWPGASDVVPPLLAVLVREGLVEDRAIGTFDYEPAYSITSYGRQLLRYLVAEPS